MRPRVAQELPRRVHIIGVCGRGTGALAIALAKCGVRVTGTDEFASPPMSVNLEEAAIPLFRVPSERNLAGVDAIIVGGGTTAAHPEVVCAFERNVPVWHFADFLGEFFLSSGRNLIVAGSKGKTTTAAMAVWIARRSGETFKYLVGGEINGIKESAFLGAGSRAIVEGDEFWTGYWDVRPKFIHYHPEVVAVTNLQPDHPEVYPDLRSYQFPFKHLVDLIPARGLLILNGDDPGCEILRSRARCPVVTVGFGSDCDFRIKNWSATAEGARFIFQGVKFVLPAYGRMNSRNAVMAVLATAGIGICGDAAAEALATFPGVRGRLEVLWSNQEFAVVQDNASSPLAYGNLLKALREKFPKRRLLILVRLQAAGVPGELGAEMLGDSLEGADVVLLGGTVPGHEDFAPPMAFLRERLRSHGVECHAMDEPECFLELLPELLQPGDVLVVCQFIGDAGLADRFAGAVSRICSRFV